MSEQNLNKCKVLRSFRLKKGDIIRAKKKNDQGQYILNKFGEKINNIVELTDTQMKEAMKMKVVELCGDQGE